MTDLTNISDEEMKILTKVLLFIKDIRPYEVCEIKLDPKNNARLNVLVKRNDLEVFDR